MFHPDNTGQPLAIQSSSALLRQRDRSPIFSGRGIWPADKRRYHVPLLKAQYFAACLASIKAGSTTSATTMRLAGASARSVSVWFMALNFHPLVHFPSPGKRLSGIPGNNTPGAAWSNPTPFLRKSLPAIPNPEALPIQVHVCRCRIPVISSFFPFDCLTAFHRVSQRLMRSHSPKKRPILRRFKAVRIPGEG